MQVMLAGRAITMLLAVSGMLVTCKARNTPQSATAAFDSVNAGAPDKNPHGRAKCWLAPVIPIQFNSALDRALETIPDPIGDGDRIGAMTAAVQTWNQILQQVGAVQVISITAFTDMVQPFAATPLNDKPCTDVALPAKPIDRHEWRIGPQVVTSTAQGRGQLALDQNRDGQQFAAAVKAGDGPGWVMHPLDMSDATDALGVALVQGAPIMSGAIAWMTHESPRGAKQCNRIPWSYAALENVPVGAYDFYSVMLHEIGHVLGLDHSDGNCAAQNGFQNVMRSTIARGVRSAIGECEFEAIAKLYGPGRACGVQN